MLQQRTKMVLAEWGFGLHMCEIKRCCQVFIGGGGLVRHSEGVKEQTRNLAVSFSPSKFHYVFLSLLSSRSHLLHMVRECDTSHA